MKKFLFTLFMILCSFSKANAQRFPITVVPQINPPAPVNFHSYADGSTINSPLRVQLLLSDITITNEQIRLKVSFEGNGVSFESKDVVVGASQLFIDGGTPLILSNVELAPYFEIQNIQGINSNIYGRTIPEGSYQFCFEVFDFTTGNRLSSKTCVTTYIFKNEPPILNLPLNKVNIEPKEIDNIVFQWTPRHINVSNVEYELSIVEIWDDVVDPQTAFLSVPPIFEATTRTTSFLYGPAQPLLLPEKRYAWRVKAKALQGAEEIGLFRNEGESEIFWFSRTSPCTTPFNIYAEPKGISKINVFWDEDPSVYTEYTIAYREANKPNAEWFTMRTNSGWATVWDLKPGTTYEYKVKGKCKFQYGSFSDIQEITTANAQDETANYNCGIVPDAIAITNREPHPNLQIGDRITAGDFVITITELDGGSSGRISGRGYVKVPYLKLARFGVKFNNVLINTDKQLARGEIVTLYDPTFGEGESMTVDVDLDVVEMITGDQGELSSGVVDFVIASIEQNENNAWVITGTNEEQAIVAGGQDVVIRDSSDTIWTVGEDGTISQGQVAEGGPVTDTSSTGISNGELSEISATGVRIDFEKSGFYAFDEIPNNVKEQLGSKYKTLTIADGEMYEVPFKAVSDIKGEDIITAKATFLDNNITKEDIVFKTKEGIKIPATWEGVIATLSLKKKSDYLIEEIIASVKPKEKNGKYTIAGALNLVHLGKQEMNAINLVIVPVNNARVNSGIQNNINAIYNKAGVNFKITIGDRLQIPESVWDVDIADQMINAGESGVLNYYSKEEKAINEYFKTQTYYNEQTYYLFVTDLKAVNSGSTKELAGFMPLKGQFGFVFQKSTDQSTTIAHELGHGVFGLEHPFTEYKTPEGSTNFLMDYKGGTTLTHMDWKKMHAPGFKLYWLQDDKEGESTKKNKLSKNEKMMKLLDHFKKSFNGNDHSLEWRKLITHKKTSSQGNNRSFYKLSDGEYKIKIDDSDELKFRLIKQPSNVKEQIKISTISNIVKFNKEKVLNIGRTYDLIYQITLNSSDAEDQFVFEFDHYNDIEKFHNYLYKTSNFSNSEISQSIIEHLDTKYLPTNLSEKTDCDDIDVYFAEIPVSHSKTLKNDQLWNALKSLLGCIADDSYTNEENAILTIVTTLSNKNTSFFLSEITDKKINNKTMLQLLFDKMDGRKKPKSFIEIVGDLVATLNTDHDKWKITNKIIEQLGGFSILQAFHEFKNNQNGQKALVTIFSSLKSSYHSKNEIPTITKLFVEMLNEDCKHLKDYKTIYQIAGDRNRNREAFAKFTQVEKIFKDNGATQSSGARSWVLPYDFYYLGNRNNLIFAKNEYAWAQRLSNVGRYNREEIKNSELLKEPYQDFFKKFREEYKLFLQNYKGKSKDFWSGITISDVNKKYQTIVDHVNKNENAKSLRNISSDIKIELLKNIITKPVKDEPLYKDIKSDALLKVAFSFRPKDIKVIEAIEGIGIKEVYKSLSGDRLSKFLAWFGQYITDANDITILEKKDITINNNQLFTGQDLKNSSSSSIIKLEQNMLQFDNDEMFVGKGNSIKVNGNSVEYKQMVMIYIVDDFKFLNHQFRKGQVLSMPLIQAFAMSNSNVNTVAKESAWLAADVVSFTIGIGAAKLTFKTGSVLAKTAYTSGVIGSGINITMKAINESAIDADTRSRLTMLGFYLSIPGQIKDIKDLNDYIFETRKRVNNVSGLSKISRDRINKYIDDISLKIPGIKNTKITKIESITGGVEELKDFNTWINTLPASHPALQKLVDLGDDVMTFAKDFRFKAGDINPNFASNPDFIDAWTVLKSFKNTRRKGGNLEALAAISKRFEYNDEVGFRGLTKLISEGSEANKKKLIEGFVFADQLFPQQVQVKYSISATKKGDVKVIIVEDGKKQEIARIVNGQLKNKKRYLTQGTVKREYKGLKILQDGDEIGFETKNIKGELFEVGDHIDGIRINRVKKGIKVGIAVIGKFIKKADARKGKVDKFLSKLNELKIKEVKTFDEVSQSSEEFIINGKSYTWQDLIDDLKNKNGKYQTDAKGEIKVNELPNTLLYKANQQWCQKIINEGYQIIEVDHVSDENVTNLFYNYQVDTFFK